MLADVAPDKLSYELRLAADLLHPSYHVSVLVDAKAQDVRLQLLLVPSLCLTL
jgi:hypothetical protein